MIETTSEMTRRSMFATIGAGVFAGITLARPAEAAEWSEVEKANVKTVNDFCATWKARDAAKTGSFFAENCVVRMAAHDPSRPPLVGQSAVVDTLKNLFNRSSVELIVEDTFAKGPLVVNSRLDRVVSQSGTRDVYYAGVFFLQRGMIIEWSDYDVTKI